MRPILVVLFLAGTAGAAPPTWTPWPPLRTVSGLGPVVGDIESHLLPGHPYREADRIGWVHEGTHSIHSNLRARFSRPGFYVLNNRAILLQEPATTLAAVARIVPPSLRGEVYSLYLVSQQGYFNEQPSYIFDEWCAYTNGLEARYRLGIRDRQETGRYAVEFIAYAVCVPWATQLHDPQVRALLQWQTERVLTLCRASSIQPKLDRLRMATDAKPLRDFTRAYFGPDWTRKTLGF